jgi:transposase
VKNHDQSTTSKFGRRYDEEFKRDAVRLLETSSRSLPQLSRELGVSAWSLKRWTTLYGRKAGAAPGGGDGPSADAAALALENARLRRELEAVSRQRDLLKKAIAILGPQP